MKAQKQIIENEQSSKISFRFSIERIHIKVKFACRLYLEYFINGEARKSQEIRIDQKNSLYKIDEFITWHRKSPPNIGFEEEGIVIYVKLLSNKGLAFTAGVININPREYLEFAEKFTIKLNKSLDFDAHCECRRHDSNPSVQKKSDADLNIDRSKTSSIYFKKRESNLSSEPQKSKFSREMISFKNQEQKEEISRSHTGSKTSDKKIRRTQSIEDFRAREKELLQKIEDLQSEIHRNRVLFDKQKEIIILLQAKQREFNEQKNQFKTQLKFLEAEIEDKRQKIRQLEGQKLKLLMNSLQSEKEIENLKQKIASLMEKVYERIKRLFRQNSQKVINEFTEKSATNERLKDDFKISLSKIAKKQRNSKQFDGISKLKEGQEMSKVAFSAVRGLMNKQVDQAWLQQSLGYRDNNPSSVLSNTLNDMSISDINGKAKDVSLLNSQFFLKPQESQHRSRSPSNSRQFIQQISKSMNKLENMIAAKMQKTIESFVQIIQKNRGNIKDNSSGQESLLGYLQQLQNGFERQLGALGQKERIIAYYEQLIQELNQTLSEKQNLVVQLQEQLFKLQEEKDQIKSQLHDANYVHALKEEEYLKKLHIFEHGKIMPDYSSSASPTHKPQARRKEPKVSNVAYEQEIIEYKEHLRMMEIDLLHEREERSKLTHTLHGKELELQEALNEKRRLEFAIKLRERMASLNESIQMPAEDEAPPKNQEKFTQESLENEQDFLNILIYQQ